MASRSSMPLDGSENGAGIQDNLENYIQSFSSDAREIFEHFKFSEFVGQLADANLLFKVVQIFAKADLYPEHVTNHDMGLVFEELIRRFAESSNETAGEHFTPRDIVNLTTSLVFFDDDDALNKDGIIRTIYDPTAGTGGFLSSGMEFIHQQSPNAVMRVWSGVKPESCAIYRPTCWSGRGCQPYQAPGNTCPTISSRIDYMLSVTFRRGLEKMKPASTTTWTQVLMVLTCPTVSGLLLFLCLISKMRCQSSGGRIGIILNGSPLFTGGEAVKARSSLHSGSSLLESIIACPPTCFYQWHRYLCVDLSNKSARRRQSQLIDNGNHAARCVNRWGQTCILGRILVHHPHVQRSEPITTTTLAALGLGENPNKIQPGTRNSKTRRQKLLPANLHSTDFGYRRLTIERPLRLSAQVRMRRLRLCALHRSRCAPMAPV
ncbi:MAG: class I SAM-dependent DNA methyltransferase [Escherichia sp.]